MFGSEITIIKGNTKMTLKPYKTLYKEIALFDYNNLYVLDNKKLISSYNTRAGMDSITWRVIETIIKYLEVVHKIDITTLGNKEIIMKFYTRMKGDDFQMFLVKPSYTPSVVIRPVVRSESINTGNAIQLDYDDVDIYQLYFTLKEKVKDNRDFIVIPRSNKIQDLSVEIESTYNKDLFEIIEIESIPGNAYKNKQKIIIKNDVDKDIAKFIKDYLK